MEFLQKMAVPISIIIAGAMIAVSLYLVNSRPVAANNGIQPTVQEEIRTVQQDDHIKGNPNAKIVVVEFSDTECPFCKQFHTTMNRIISEYGASGDVAWVYRHFPIPSLHPKAPKQAEALECAAEQGGNEMFWKFTDMLYERTNANNSLDIGVYNTPETIPVGQDGKPRYTEREPRSSTDAGQLSDFAQELGLNVAQFEACVASGKHKARVDADAAEAVAAGGQGTPHSVLIVDGEQIPLEGAQPYDMVKGLIDSLL
ncbi:MAG TPA: thioredoxin domain-containing protein [Candidatus Paceibacterota bacterium]|nr:thioredoxin domain-containing protein [Candidatus Paceibacterota bacterium]